MTRRTSPPTPAAPAVSKVPVHILPILAQMRGRENVVEPYQTPLDRKIYEDLNTVLVALGGKWKRGKGHVFEPGVNAAELLENVVASGEYVDPRQNDFFWSPPPVVQAVVERLDLRPSHAVLEPSAGRGHLARGIAAAIFKDRGAWLLDTIDVFEILPAFQKSLREEGFRVVGSDFLAAQPGAKHPAGGIALAYDRIGMNSPFSGGADVTHIAHAYRFLVPGGRLVAVMAAGVMFNERRHYADFKRGAEALGGRFETLPEGSFKPAGTAVNTVLLTIDKPHHMAIGDTIPTG